MDAEKYTKNSLQALNDAESVADSHGNGQLMGVHLLYALLSSDGLIFRMLTRSGIDADGLKSACERD